MTNLIKNMLAAVLVLLSSACSSPSLEQIEPHIRAHFAYALEQGIFEIENMKYMDGNSGAADTYLADLEFDVLFKKNQKDIVRHAQRHSAGTPIETFHRNEELFSLMTTFGKFKANTRVHIKAQVTLKETEEHWNATLISIFVQ